jgi:hypothetical protein
MATDEPPSDTGGGARADRREQGIDLGPLADELLAHEYPTTTDELVDEYGAYQIELQDGTRSAGEILGGREGANEAYESTAEVRRMICNLVGSDAVGREAYSDRGGMAGDREDIGGSDGVQRSF